MKPRFSTMSESSTRTLPVKNIGELYNTYAKNPKKNIKRLKHTYPLVFEESPEELFQKKFKKNKSMISVYMK